MVKRVKKQKLLWKIGKTKNLLLVCYIVLAFLLSEMIIYANDMIAKATDKVMLGEQIKLQSFIVSLVLIALVGAIVAFAKSYCASAYNAGIQKDMKVMLEKHILELPLSCFEQNGSGSIMTRLSSDMNEVGRFFSEVLPEFLVNLITVVTVTYYLIQMDAMLMVILFASYPLMLFISNWLSKRLAKIVKKYRTRMDDRAQAAYDVIQGINITRSYNLYNIMKRRLETIIDDIARQSWKSTRISSLSWVIESVITTIPVVCCYLFALYETLEGRITTGEMLAFTILLGRMIYPLGDVVFCLNDMRTAGVSFARLEEIYQIELEEQGEKDFRADAAIIWDMASKNVDKVEQQEAICWNQVSFAYKEGQQLLKELSFYVKQGETIAFVGGSGEGKSTIFKLLCGFYQRNTGNYELYGKSFEEWNLQAARACFSLVSQNVFLFPVSIWENVAFGKEYATKEEVVKACKLANIHDFIEKLPQGYDTIVGERGVRLSGGERQRISIARAFLKDAPILLLDEPTAAVDIGTEELLQEAIDRISKGRTVIIIAHRLSTVEHADRIYVVKNGKIAEYGTHKYLLEQDGVYVELMNCVKELEKGANNHATTA